MKKMGANEVREKFLAFFESKDHLRMKSHSLVPENDKSLLLINSGMAPLKPFFTGQEIPPSKRVTTCQKCIRTGDIENVGKTARHGTFFEMLGDFSFGDYFKEEIIPWSWEFCTEVMEIPAERLYISVYEDDDESAEIWNKKVGIPLDKIFRMGKDDNFWEVGLGPCGPCSEIYYDRGEKYGCGGEACTVGCDCDRYMEFWNLVFTQFSKETDGSYSKLASPNIDTGMGLERMAVLMQDVYSIFDIDTIKAVRDKVCETASVNYMENASRDVSIRVITDHARAMTFLTGDGVLPSNEGRGYVLRRLIRRAARHGKTLGVKGTFLSGICGAVIDVSKGAYPELLEKIDYILKVITFEEQRFLETLDQGEEILKSYIEQLRKENRPVMEGIMSFKLYDTFGFPADLTKEILEGEGIAFNEESFRTEMENQRKRAREAREESSFMGKAQTVYEQLPVDISTEFAGYDDANVDGAVVLAIVSGDKIADTANEGDEISIFVDKTPFYAAGGGQCGDTGIISTDNCDIEITDCVKTAAGKTAHIGVVKMGNISVSERVTISHDKDKRTATARNHSATHLLQRALREVLGTHVEQAGSLVTPEKLRFDFTHFSAMTREELEKVERKVIDKIFDALPVEISMLPIEDARKKGAMALFGEKYGDVVRVVDMDGDSVELCGGCHVQNTSNIGMFKILSESGVASGVRRIEAITGYGVIGYYKDLEEIITNVGYALKTSRENIMTRITTVMNEMKDYSRQAEALKAKMAGSLVDEILENCTEANGIKVVRGTLSDMDMNSLRSMGDQLRDKLKSGVVALAGTKDGSVNLLVMATDDAVKAGVHAGKIISKIAPLVDGKGGGKPNMAQAGGKNPAGIAQALEKAIDEIGRRD